MIIKTLTEACNQTKKDIDLIKAKLDEKAEDKKKQMREELLEDEDNADQQQEIIDEEEL